jgi:hypothetical protein
MTTTSAEAAGECKGQGDGRATGEPQHVSSGQRSHSDSPSWIPLFLRILFIFID